MASKRTARGGAHGARSHVQRDLGPTVEPHLGVEEDEEEEEEEEDEVVPSQVQKPRMKWVYNSDHTDPVNFGFMFLVPDDGSDAVPNKSALPSTGRASLNNITASTAYPAVSPLRSSSSSNVSSIPAPEGSYLAILDRSRSISPDVPQQINPHATFFTNPNYPSGNDSVVLAQDASHSPITYPPSTSSYSDASPQQLAYRTSPHFASSNLPLQQLTPGENFSW